MRSVYVCIWNEYGNIFMWVGVCVILCFQIFMLQPYYQGWDKTNAEEVKEEAEEEEEKKEKENIKTNKKNKIK